MLHNIPIILISALLPSIYAGSASSRPNTEAADSIESNKSVDIYVSRKEEILRNHFNDMPMPNWPNVERYILSDRAQSIAYPKIEPLPVLRDFMAVKFPENRKEDCLIASLYFKEIATATLRGDIKTYGQVKDLVLAWSARASRQLCSNDEVGATGGCAVFSIVMRYWLGWCMQHESKPLVRALLELHTKKSVRYKDCIKTIYLWKSAIVPHHGLGRIEEEWTVDLIVHMYEYLALNTTRLPPKATKPCLVDMVAANNKWLELYRFLGMSVYNIRIVRAQLFLLRVQVLAMFALYDGASVRDRLKFVASIARPLNDFWESFGGNKNTEILAEIRKTFRAIFLDFVAYGNDYDLQGLYNESKKQFSHYPIRLALLLVDYRIARCHHLTKSQNKAMHRFSLPMPKDVSDDLVKAVRVRQQLDIMIKENGVELIDREEEIRIWRQSCRKSIEYRLIMYISQPQSMQKFSREEVQDLYRPMQDEESTNTNSDNKDLEESVRECIKEDLLLEREHFFDQTPEALQQKILQYMRQVDR